MHVLEARLGLSFGAVAVDFEQHELAVVRDAALGEGRGGEGDAAEGFDGVDVELGWSVGLEFHLGSACFLWCSLITAFGTVGALKRRELTTSIFILCVVAGSVDRWSEGVWEVKDSCKRWRG